MNLINCFASNAADEIAALSPAETRELEAWLDMVDEVEQAWERLADAVDTGAI